MDIPASLRRWFVAHFVVDLLVGLPLLIMPAKFLGALHWPVVDPVSPRVVGAALLAIGVQSFIGRHDGAEAYRSMLNFKLLWSWAAIGALVIAAAEGAPDAVWAFMAVFIAFSGVWFHYRVRIGQMEEAEDHNESDHAPDDEMAAMLNDPKLAHEAPPAGDAEKVHAGTSFDKLGAEDIAAFAAERGKQSSADAEREAAEQAARAAAELAAWEASDPDADANPPSSTKTLQGMTRDQLDDELTGAAVESDEAIADRLAADDIAAMLAANRGDDEEPPAAKPAPTAPEPAAEPAQAAAADEAAADDIAAMLAANQGGDDQGSAEDIAAMLAAQTGETATEAEAPRSDASADEAAGADDIAAMLAANASDEPAPPTSEPAANNESAGADDIAAMLAANTSDEPTTFEVDMAEDEVTRPGTQPSDFAHLATLAAETARAAEASVAAAEVPAPEEVTNEDVATDDIAAMLAANRRENSPG
jgi:hypothetical protein